MKNLNIFINEVDYWFVLDNSKEKLLFIAEGNHNQITIFDEDTWKKLI